MSQGPEPNLEVMDVDQRIDYVQQVVAGGRTVDLQEVGQSPDSTSSSSSSSSSSVQAFDQINYEEDKETEELALSLSQLSGAQDTLPIFDESEIPDSFDISEMLSPQRVLKAEDFEIDRFMSEGGWAKVYSATRKTDGVRVAMKFFGYAFNKSSFRHIASELITMSRLENGQ
jgi:hypothetical protein